MVTRSLFDSNPKDHSEWSGESEAGAMGRSLAGTLLNASQIWATGAQSLLGAIWETVGVGERHQHVWELSN